MYTVRTLPEFDKWLKGLRDRTAQGRLVARLRKASLGNLGDVKPVGGGYQSSQRTDVAVARRRAAQITEE